LYDGSGVHPSRYIKADYAMEDAGWILRPEKFDGLADQEGCELIRGRSTSGVLHDLKMVVLVCECYVA
jgi:hypothetical protein